jgi:hypothetical protein
VEKVATHSKRIDVVLLDTMVVAGLYAVTKEGGGKEWRGKEESVEGCSIEFDCKNWRRFCYEGSYTCML